MNIRMENAEGLNLPQMEALLGTSQEVRFAATGRGEVYEWVERVLVRQEYADFEPRVLCLHYFFLAWERSEAIGARSQAWRAAYLATPHGHEVLLGNADKARNLVKTVLPKIGGTRGLCPAGCDRALEYALITAPEARDPALLKKLQAVAGRAL